MTLTVQIIPFVHGGLYVVSLLIYSFGSETVSQVADTLVYISPLTIGCFLLLSSTLRLCKWHKTACCVPLLPNIVSFVDYYIIELSEIALLVGLLVIASMILLLLVSAYHVFLC